MLALRTVTYCTENEETPIRVIGKGQVERMVVYGESARTWLRNYLLGARGRLLQRIELTDGKLKAAFVVSRAIKGTKIGGEVTEALTGYGLPILQTRITQRVIYPSSAASGTTAIDQEPASEAAEEVRALAKEVRHFLNSTI